VPDLPVAETRRSKQAEVIALPHWPEGVTVDKIKVVTGRRRTRCAVFFACAEEEARSRYRRDQPGLPYRQGRDMILVAQVKKARRESGGPTRCGDLAVGRAGADIEARLVARSKW
jgi:hypothetical protein